MPTTSGEDRGRRLPNRPPRRSSRDGEAAPPSNRGGPGQAGAARLVAFDVLRAVAERDAFANLLLPRLLDRHRLSPRDAALATELTYGTLRAVGTYDEILAACVDRPLEAVDLDVLDALRLGTHQLLGTRVPPHAAVATTVDLARQTMGGGTARFVNAVLRRLAAEDMAGWTARLAPDEQRDPEGHLAFVHAHPRWIVEALWDALAAHRGRQRAREEITRLLAADNARPQVILAARPGLSTAAQLCRDAEAAGLRATPGRYSPYGVELEVGDPLRIAAVAEGRAGVQDEGSQLVTLAVAGAEVTGPDRVWMDLCAGPGGKAALLAGLAARPRAEGASLGEPASLLAVELQERRARLVADAVRGVGGVQVVVADSMRPAWRDGVADRVLLDAPCTGLGALRRRPEARWRREPADVSRLTDRQRRLLVSALDSVRPGGLVGYVTCSPHLAETRIVVEQTLRGRSDVERVDARPHLPGVPDLGDGPDVQLWPHLHGTDAMYLALLRRR